MKSMNIKKLMTIIGLVAITISAHAQNSVQEISQAFDDFYGKLYKAGYVTSSSQDNYKDGYEKELYFALPKDNDKIVKEYDNQLFDYSRQAYSSFVKKAGTQNISTFKILYGEGNQQSNTFGSYSNRNYNVQLFRDRKDSTMRYAYALVWYTSKKNILGSAYEFYGKDPRLTKVQTRNGNWTINENGIQGPGVSITENGIELADGVSLDGTMKKLFGDGDDDSDEFANDSVISKTLSADSTEVEKLKTSEDVIQKFTNLQIIYSKLNDKYKDYKEFSGTERLKMLNTRRLMIATNNQIRMLVNTGRLGRMLSNDDKNFIADQLNEMSSESKDKWLKKSLKDLSTSLLKE